METRDSFMLRALHGRIISTDFFRRNWLVVIAAMLMLMVYITERKSVVDGERGEGGGGGAG